MKSLIGIDLGSVRVMVRSKSQVMELNEDAYDIARARIESMLKDSLGSITGITI
jgi:hypothetical protein